MIPGTKPLHESCWRHHRHIPARFWGEVRQVPRDQTVGAASQGHFKERFIVGVRKACGERLWSGGLADKNNVVEQRSDRIRVEAEPRSCKDLVILCEYAGIETQGHSARRQHADDLTGRTEWREEPRDEHVGVEHYPQRVRALRTAAISASISSWDSASVPRATERRCIAATASTARA